MKSIKRGTIFVISISEGALKVAKYLARNAKGEFQNLETEALPAGSDDKALCARIKAVLEKLSLNNNPLILSLPRNQATCRYLKVPAGSLQEIEKMVAFQAARYLPYPANELITGFEIIATDKADFAHLNLVIVHRNVIERYLNIFRALNIKNFGIYLSSYGLSNLYALLSAPLAAPVMVIDMDTQEVESVIIYNAKLVFSRYFKINRGQPGWENLFMDEVNKTRDAYSKEVAFPAPERILLLGETEKPEGLLGVLSRRLEVPVELLPAAKKLGLAQNLADKILSSGNSFYPLIGLGLKDIPASLVLATEEAKARSRRITRYKEQAGIILSIAALIALWSLILAKALDNKAAYLKRLNMELSRIATQAQPLEETAKRISLLENSSQKRISGLDVLFELHQILSPQVLLLNLSFEENSQIILHGQAPELNAVFALVSKLGESAVFKKFNAKVHYATSKKTQAGEIVDFEIVCTKK